MQSSEQIPIEQEKWFDLQSAEYTARQTDKSQNREIGEIWSISFMSGSDGVHYFAFVLKIGEENYRFFHTPEEAATGRILRGIDRPPTNRFRMKYGAQAMSPIYAAKITS